LLSYAYDYKSNKMTIKKQHKLIIIIIIIIMKRQNYRKKAKETKEKKVDILFILRFGCMHTSILKRISIIVIRVKREKEKNDLPALLSFVDQ